jgi:hypothetical protein
VRSKFAYHLVMKSVVVARVVIFFASLGADKFKTHASFGLIIFPFYTKKSF